MATFTNNLCSFVAVLLCFGRWNNSWHVKEDIGDTALHIWQNLLLFNMFTFLFYWKFLIQRSCWANVSTQGEFHHLQSRWHKTIYQKAKWGKLSTGEHASFEWRQKETEASLDLSIWNWSFGTVAPLIAASICTHTFTLKNFFWKYLSIASNLNKRLQRICK